MAGAPTETKKEYHISKAFKSLNTKANRTAIDEEEFSWLENVQPIGAGNLRIIPTSSRALTNTGANVVFSANVASMFSQEIVGNSYVTVFTSNGAAQLYDVNNLTLSNIAANGTLSTSNVTSTQFNKNYIIVGDPTKGLSVWDNNVFVQMGSGGAVGMLNVGTGYTAPPAVIVSAPNQAGGIQAAAEAVLVGNVVSEVIWTQPGTGYTAPPTITITGGGGNNAQAVASLLSFKTGQIYYQLLNGGTGFTSGNVTVTGGGGDGTAVGTFIVANGSIINIIPTSLGNNYSNQANLVVTINGGGTNAQVSAFVESNAVTDVQTYAGRLWVSQGRQLIYSAATNFNDFVGLSAGSFYVTDTTLHGNILAMVVANNFLYFYGDDSINVISDVLVNSTGTTNLTNTNVGASIGTPFTGSIFPYYRYIMFQNAYGVYGLIGSTTVKLSDALDGIYQYIDFTQPVTSGQVIINNILCACFNFYCNTGTAFGGNRWIQAVFFDKKWFFTSQGTLNYVCYTPVGNTIGMFGAAGASLYRMYTDTGNAISSITQTALWPLGDPIRDKQASKLAVEATFTSGIGSMDLTVDNPVGSSAPINFSALNTVTWYNNASQTIPWANNTSAIIGWAGGSLGYQLYRADAQQPPGGTSGQKYIGFTITSNTPNFVLNTFELEYEKRARF